MLFQETVSCRCFFFGSRFLPEACHSVRNGAKRATGIACLGFVRQHSMLSELCSLSLLREDQVISCRWGAWSDRFRPGCSFRHRLVVFRSCLCSACCTVSCLCSCVVSCLFAPDRAQQSGICSLSAASGSTSRHELCRNQNLQSLWSHDGHRPAVSFYIVLTN